MTITRRHRNERIAAALLVLVLAAVVIGFLRWNAAQEEEFHRDLRYIPKENTITAEVLLLQEYVRIDTSHPKGEAAGARWVAAQLQKRGVRAEVIESAPDHLTVYARIRGTKPGDGLLLFNHVDVVPAGEGWRHAPYEGALVANMLHGRGALDMKGLAICQLLAFADVAQSGRTPEHDLVFLATSDEETGGELGMKWLLAHRPDIFEGIRYGITEGGITEMMSENMTYFGIEVGGKQHVRLTLTAAAIEQLRRTRVRLEPFIDSVDATRILPEVRQYFADVAPTRKAFKSLLSDVDRAIHEGQVWRLPKAYRDLTQNSLIVYAPVQPVGERPTMGVWMLNLPDEEPDARIAWLRHFVASDGVSVEVVSKEGPVPLSPTGTPLFTILADAARSRYRVSAGTQVLYRSASDARFLRARGIVCYGICPYPVDFFQSLSIHNADERIRLDWFVEGVDYTREVVRRWAWSGRER